MQTENDLLRQFPAAVYTTDASGRILSCNPAAVALWGASPRDGDLGFPGGWTLRRADGAALPHGRFPTAEAIGTACDTQGVELVAERPDGARLALLAHAAPTRDAGGTVTGAVTTLVDITARRDAERALRWLAAIVDSANDAILSKDLRGTITSWNRGAERLFGYSPAEAVGRSVTMLVPDDRHDEETIILNRLRLGERVEPFETARRHKDGRLVDISLSVSPIVAEDGSLAGASQVARDITARRLAEQRQRLLLNEMNHRVKNLLVLAGGVVALSARSATTVQELASDVRDRLGALARAQDLTLPKAPGLLTATESSTSLHALIATIVSPFDVRSGDGEGRVVVTGPDVPVAAGGPLTSLALLVHEFATNAAKYGALSTPAGVVDIACFDEGASFVLVWTERGGPAVRRDGDASGDGFGSLLARATVRGQLDGEISRNWRPEGLVIRLSVARQRLAG